LDSIFLALRNEKLSGTITHGAMAIIEELEELRERDWDHNATPSVSPDHTPEPGQIYELPYEYYLESLSYYNL
jgi:hypothetical protein